MRCNDVRLVYVSQVRNQWLLYEHDTKPSGSIQIGEFLD
jgi:hypothetical protein